MKPMQVHTSNYRHLWSPVDSLMPHGNKKSYLKFQVCLSNMHELLLPPDIKELKSIYTDHNFVTLHWMPDTQYSWWSLMETGFMKMAASTYLYFIRTRTNYILLRKDTINLHCLSKEKLVISKKKLLIQKTSRIDRNQFLS